MRKILPGKPYPLGATWNGNGVNFAIFSEKAERVGLCLFDADGQQETLRTDMPEHTDHIWHAYLEDVRAGGKGPAVFSEARERLLINRYIRNERGVK